MSLTNEKVLQLQEKAKVIRQSVIDMLIEAGSGHTAGSLDMADIFTYLYFHSLKHDPKNPKWEYRDRLILSNGHICPVLYATMAHSGYFPIEQLKTLRKFGSPLQGHPDRNFLRALETSSGPLGSGLSQAVGMALADRMDFGNTSGRKFFCLMSDGELDEGNSWEAIMLAGKEKLHNLIAIVDRNCIQISGNTEDVMPLDPLGDKWRAFNWEVIEIDGHDFLDIDKAIEKAKINSKSTVIIAKTIASKGIPEYEGKYEWHGKVPHTTTLMTHELRSAGTQDTEVTPLRSSQAQSFVAQAPLSSMRAGVGEGLIVAANTDKRVVALSADLAESTGISEFTKKFRDRYVEVGVAEQNLVTVASGLASAGKIPFVCSYAIFSPGRNWEQIRTTICYNNQPVKIISTHAGLNVGPDGGSHQALEDIALMRVLPNMVVISPCDAIEAKKAIIAIAKTNNPSYVRVVREKSPIITNEDSHFAIGKAQIIFEHHVESNAKKVLHKIVGEKHIIPTVGIIATGPIVYKALMVAKRLAQEGKNVSVMNISTIKPLDEEAVIKFAHKMGAIVTCEEHQLSGGLGSVVAECLSAHFPTPIEFVAVRNKFGQSGKAEELLEHYGLGEEDIYSAVKRVLIRKG
jgi:transketolase